VAGTDTVIATGVIETASENVIAIVTVTGIVTGIGETMSEKIANLAAEIHHPVFLLQSQRTARFQLGLTLGTTGMVRLRMDWAKDEDLPTTIPKEALSGALERTDTERTEIDALLTRTHTIEEEDATLTEGEKTGRVPTTILR